LNKNIDENVVEDFGHEWSNFNQNPVPEHELEDLFKRYFSIFPDEVLSNQSIGFDLGCGSGRWAKLIAPKVGCLHCIDPSDLALNTAKMKLTGFDNCQFHLASVDSMPLEDGSMDFGYSLGVLHHVPDTESGILHCVDKLKPGAPFLLYLYYAFDNRPYWYRLIWKLSDVFRLAISRLAFPIKKMTSFFIALLVYFPLARVAYILEKLRINVRNLPLSEYRSLSFYTMRTDALDRFGTRLEKRFTKQQIIQMLQRSGLENIKFSSESPYWCVISYKKKSIN